MQVQPNVKDMLSPSEILSIKEKALQEVNQIRTKYGLDPIYEFPKGRIQCPTSCVVSAALNGIGINPAAVGYLQMDSHTGIWTADWAREGKLYQHELSETIVLFIGCFDHGLYPELIDGEDTSDCSGESETLEERGSVPAGV